MLTNLGRQCSNTKDKIQLCDGKMVLDSLRVRHHITIRTQECRSVQHWKQWCPFLEEDIDQLIGYKSRGRLEGGATSLETL